LARLMASKDDAHLLGDTEFQVRDRVHDLGPRWRRGDSRSTGQPR
jgi:hypothetical protein